MKKISFIVAALVAGSNISFAQKSAKDSIKQVNLQEVVVVATRATQKTPVAFTNVTNKEIKKRNFGQDIPYLLSMTPSVITTSDAGTGIGYTSLSVRGTDATRINITTNGIPMNDAESHQLYWVNTPDLSSSVNNIQIQRGAGTSTNGASAFGASVNILTESIPFKPYTELSGSYGSFNTNKETVKFGTGLLNNHWAFEGRLSHIASDGYIDRAYTKLYSYFAQGGYFTDDMSLRLVTFSGKEETYHAWDYTSKADMKKFGRKFNSCGLYFDDKGDSAFYKNQTDNYKQTHYQLLFNKAFNPNLSFNAGLHYTRGDGYYEQYKLNRKLTEYGLDNFTVDGVTTKKSDLVRQKRLANDFYGGVFSLLYNNDKLSTTFGGGLNYYDGDHFGKVVWVRNYIGSINPDHEYYRNNAKKTDGNLYFKANYEIVENLNLFADLQYRHINYKINGSSEDFDYNSGVMQQLDMEKNFDFFNPKVGLNWQINNQNRIYGSFSVAQKEPTRKAYTEGYFNIHPTSEKLNDYEFGYIFANRFATAGINLYYMDYKDQLILTGEVNEISQPVRANTPNSYRSGVELMLGVKPTTWFDWNINGTLSRNRIKNFTEILYDENYEMVKNTYKNTPIAYSPDLIIKNQFALNHKGFSAALSSQYISKQYMCNAKIDDARIDAYFVSDLNLAYTFKTPSIKSVTVGLTIYNIFNEEYENYGYVESSYNSAKGIRNTKGYYAAQAGTNVLGNISLRF